MADRSKTADMIRRARTFCEPFRVTDGAGFRLKTVDPEDTLHLTPDHRAEAQEHLAQGVQLLAEMQDKLYAQDKWAVLLIFQALDAAGKDSAIKHVMSGVNPQGCNVHAFKAPSAEELDHDYLWRCMKALPNRGHIGIFNRSYYEEVLVVRVHPEYLKAQKIPPHLIGKHIWRQRFEDIVNFERYMSRNGVAICKFFLHVSKEEQKRRFLERIDNPAKNWKFSYADIQERGFWDHYQKAYEDMIRLTATPFAPWYVVPADHKWFTRLVVAAAVINTLGALDLKYPEVPADKREELAAARKQLMTE